MNDIEKNIRDYLKTLTPEEIANSVYLFGVNFDSISMDLLFEKLFSLYENVTALRNMIDDNFSNGDGPKILLPKSSEIQSIIIRDCYCKADVLNKILENTTILNEFNSRFKVASTKNKRPR